MEKEGKRVGWVRGICRPKDHKHWSRPPFCGLSVGLHSRALDFARGDPSHGEQESEQG